MAIVDRLTAHDPTNTGWQRDRSLNQSMLAELLLTNKNIDGASASARAGLAISERLAHQEQSNADWQTDLSCVI